MADSNLQCPQCGKSIRYGSTHAGTTVPCPVCGAPLAIPPLAPPLPPPTQHAPVIVAEDEEKSDRGTFPTFSTALRWTRRVLSGWERVPGDPWRFLAIVIFVSMLRLGGALSILAGSLFALVASVHAFVHFHGGFEEELFAWLLLASGRLIGSGFLSFAIAELMLRAVDVICDVRAIRRALEPPPRNDNPSEHNDLAK